jgi:mannose-1-phosphate guanylyltransferase
MFFWRVSTYLDALKEFLPQTYVALEELARHIGKRSYEPQLQKIYSRLENISVDYAILERATRSPGASRVFVIPAEIGWSDVGSWAAVYELQAKQPGDNIFSGPGHALDADGNFFWAPGKFVAAIGVHDLIVVETPDALLICPRDRAQDVSKVVKELEARNRKNLF